MSVPCRKVTPAQLTKQLKELVAVIHSLEGIDKGEFDDPRQQAFDELVRTACILQHQIYRRAAAATDAQMAYALFWEHYECDSVRLADDAADGVGLAIIIGRHVPAARASILVS